MSRLVSIVELAGLVILCSVMTTHTEHHGHQVGASREEDFRATAVHFDLLAMEWTQYLDTFRSCCEDHRIVHQENSNPVAPFKVERNHLTFWRLVVTITRRSDLCGCAILSFADKASAVEASLQPMLMSKMFCWTNTDHIMLLSGSGIRCVASRQPAVHSSQNRLVAFLKPSIVGIFVFQHNVHK